MEKSEEKKHSVKVMIAGKQYSFLASVEEEEYLRLAAKKISEQVDGFSQKYKFSEVQDLLAVVALQTFKRWLMEKDADNSKKILKEIELMDTQLGDYINNTR